MFLKFISKFSVVLDPGAAINLLVYCSFHFQFGKMKAPKRDDGRKTVAKEQTQCCLSSYGEQQIWAKMQIDRSLLADTANRNRYEFYWNKNKRNFT